jgi:hypothetical protein
VRERENIHRGYNICVVLIFQGLVSGIYQRQSNCLGEKEEAMLIYEIRFKGLIPNIFIFTKEYQLF